MNFSVTILGTNAAIPGKDTITSAQVVNINQHLYLMDCGEGTQMKLQKFHFKRNRIKAIFISHLHGDHIFGLPGLLTSFGHFQRKVPITLIGPVGIKDFVETIIKISVSFIDFEIIYIELDEETQTTVYNDGMVEVMAFPLAHRIKTFGYRMYEIQKILKIIPSKIEEYNLTIDQIKSAKMGDDITLANGSVIANGDLTFPKIASRSYSYCTDTLYDESIIPYISGSSLLYHEATYLHDMAVQAKERMHSTAYEAGKIAAISGVGKLIIGHFSTRYDVHDLFLKQAKDIFEESFLSVEGEEFEIK